MTSRSAAKLRPRAKVTLGSTGEVGLVQSVEIRRQPQGVLVGAVFPVSGYQRVRPREIR